MRHFIVKAATCAFLGLSAVILGAGSSPLATRAATDVTTQSLGVVSIHKLAGRAKPVPRMRNYGYTPTGVGTFPGRPIRWTIRKPGVVGFVDEITIDRSLGIIHVENANNKADKTSNKLTLSDIAMSLFVYDSGKLPSDLTSVVFERISEDDTIAFLEPMLLAAGYHANNSDVTITVTPDDKETFAKLEALPFGKSLGWLSTDFGAPSVTSFVIRGPLKEPFLTANLR